MTSTTQTQPTSTARPVPETPAGDPRDRFARTAAVVIDVVGSIAPDQHGRATPCESMTVAQLAEHVVMATRRVACAGRGLPLDEWPIDAADVPAGRWADAIAAAAADVAVAWGDDDLLDRPTALPWGTFPGRDVLDIYVNELVVHSADLAASTGLTPDWDDDLLVASLAIMHSQLPDADRVPLWEALFAQVPDGVAVEVPFGNAVEVAPDAPLLDRLLAWNGRRP